MNTKYLLITFALFTIEVIIALFIKDSFIRPFLGDVLVVMLIFSFVRTFYNGDSKKLAFGVLLFSFLIETLQYFDFIGMLKLNDNTIARTVLGTTFSKLDLLAYVFGVFVIYVLDKKINNPLT